jgi:hypothetical protein
VSDARAQIKELNYSEADLKPIIENLNAIEEESNLLVDK